MRIAYLKWKLKNTYMKIKYDFLDYSCGHKMLLGISSRYYNLCIKFNKTSDMLSKLDSATPKFRYNMN